ncbi:MAG: hypothetical protein JNL01_08260 [Bdellovibrionales bacterium]|nr:hypothetical protein [Bdellovibrionales bacterium]
MAISVGLHVLPLSLLQSPKNSDPKPEPLRLTFQLEPERLKPRKLNLGLQYRLGGYPGTLSGLRLKENTFRDTSDFWGQGTKESLLKQDSRAFSAFDHLALLIHQKLDYPPEFIENSISGQVTLNLYFDSEGRIEEYRSDFTGDSRILRGLFVKATRDALIAWYRSQALHLRAHQFVGQHFQAQFGYSFVPIASDESLKKIAPGQYLLARKVYLHSCATPTGVDLFCAAVKGVRQVKKWTDDYKIRWIAMKDRFEAWDERGLSGINTEISRVY